MKILSLFDGISCGMLALQRAGIPVERYDAFEIDKYAVTVSKKNYPEIVHHGNVFDGDFTAFQGYDLLLGGSPCTYWSIAKKGRETTSDGMSFKLFMEYVRALHESECRYFLYENNHSLHQNIKDEISKQLGVEPVMINPALFSGAAQRGRYVDKNNTEQHIEIRKDNKSNCVTTVQKDSLVCSPIRVEQYGKGGQGQRIYSVRGKSVTLSANGGGQGAKTGLYKVDLPDGDYTIRKLTPVEAERLQTLPDNYTAGISNTQRYKCIGNAWTVDVIAHILGGLHDR